MRTALKVLLGPLWILLSACHSPFAPKSRPIEADLSAAKTTLQFGDSTLLTLVVRNISTIPKTYDVAAGNGPFDVLVENTVGVQVWRLSHQIRSFPTTKITILPGYGHSFQWFLRVGRPMGLDLPVGEYRVKGFFINARDEVIAEAATAIDIVIR